MHHWYEYGYEGFPSGERRRRFFRQRDDPCDSQEDLSGDDNDEVLECQHGVSDEGYHLSIADHNEEEEEDPFDAIERHHKRERRKQRIQRKRLRRHDARSVEEGPTEEKESSRHASRMDATIPAGEVSLLSSGGCTRKRFSREGRVGTPRFTGGALHPLRYSTCFHSPFPIYGKDNDADDSDEGEERGDKVTEKSLHGMDRKRSAYGGTDDRKARRKEVMKWEKGDEESFTDSISSADSFFTDHNDDIPREEIKDNKPEELEESASYSPLRRGEDGMLSCALHSDPRLRSCFGGTCLSFVLQRENRFGVRRAFFPQDRKQNEERPLAPSSSYHACPPTTSTAHTLAEVKKEVPRTRENVWISVAYGGAPPYTSSLASTSFSGKDGHLPASRGAVSGNNGLPMIRGDFTIMCMTAHRRAVCLTNSCRGSERREGGEGGQKKEATPSLFPLWTDACASGKSSDEEDLHVAGGLSITCTPLDHCSPSLLVRVADWRTLHPALRTANPKLSAHLVAPPRVGHAAVPLPTSSATASALLFRDPSLSSPSSTVPFTSPGSFPSPSPTHWWLLSIVFGGTSTLLNERHHRVGGATLRQCRLEGKALSMIALCATLIVEEEEEEEAQRQDRLHLSSARLQPTSLPTAKEKYARSCSSCSVRKGPTSTWPTSKTPLSMTPPFRSGLTHHQLYFPLFPHGDRGEIGLLDALAFATLTPWKTSFSSPPFSPTLSPCASHSPTSPFRFSCFSFVVMGGTRNGWDAAALDVLPLLHVDTTSWTWTTSEVRTTGAIPLARYAHSATVLPCWEREARNERGVWWEEGEAKDEGQERASEKELWWERTPLGRRQRHRQGTVPAVIVVVGGVGKHRQYLSDVHVLHTSTCVWREYTSTPHPMTSERVRWNRPADDKWEDDAEIRKRSERGATQEKVMLEKRDSAIWELQDPSSLSTGRRIARLTPTQDSAFPFPPSSLFPLSVPSASLERGGCFPYGGPRGRAFHSTVWLSPCGMCHVGKGVSEPPKTTPHHPTEEERSREEDGEKHMSFGTKENEEDHKGGVEGNGKGHDTTSPRSMTASLIHALLTSRGLAPSSSCYCEKSSSLRSACGDLISRQFSTYIDTLLEGTMQGASETDQKGILHASQHACFPSPFTGTLSTTTISFSSTPLFHDTPYGYVMWSSLPNRRPTYPSRSLLSRTFWQTFSSPFPFVSDVVRGASSPACRRYPRGVLPATKGATPLLAPSFPDADAIQKGGGEVPYEEKEEIVLLLIGGEGEDGLASSLWSLHLPQGEWRLWSFPFLSSEGGGGMEEDERPTTNPLGGTVGGRTEESDKVQEPEREAGGYATWGLSPRRVCSSSLHAFPSTSWELEKVTSRWHPVSTAPFSSPLSCAGVPAVGFQRATVKGTGQTVARGCHFRGCGDVKGRRDLTSPLVLPRVVDGVESQTLRWALRQEAERMRERREHRRNRLTSCVERGLSPHHDGGLHVDRIPSSLSHSDEKNTPFYSFSHSYFSITVGSLPQVAVIPPLLWSGTMPAEDNEEELTENTLERLATFSLAKTTMGCESSSCLHRLSTSGSWRSCAVLIMGGSSSLGSTFLTTSILPSLDSLRGMTEMRLLSARRGGGMYET